MLACDVLEASSSYPLMVVRFGFSESTLVGRAQSNCRQSSDPSSTPCDRQTRTRRSPVGEELIQRGRVNKSPDSQVSSSSAIQSSTAALEETPTDSFDAGGSGVGDCFLERYFMDVCEGELGAAGDEQFGDGEADGGCRDDIAFECYVDIDLME
jgi:hypothetical protein